MKKTRFFAGLLVLVMLLSVLSGCACEHEWAEANCKDPKTCKLCGETEGDPLSHQWVDADCKSPKTCKLCGETEGNPTDDHQWEEATTEQPKTCGICGKTEGEKINVDSRFKTDKCKEIFGTWECAYDMDATQLGMAGLVISMKFTMFFSNDGKMETRVELNDKAAFEADFTAYMVELMYQQFEASGVSREQADTAFQAQYGMSLQAYCAEQAKATSANMSNTGEMVYYVDEGKIYAAVEWDDEMEPEDYEIKDGKMLFSDRDLGETLTFTKVEA